MADMFYPGQKDYIPKLNWLATQYASISVSVTVAAPLTSTGGANPVIGISPATADAAGSMSAADKAKLDGIAAAAAAVGNVVAKALGSAVAGVSTSAARADHVHPMPAAADVGAVATSAIGAANGVAPLDASGKVAAAYLPSYVDDVLEFATLAAFPAAGEAGKIYVADDSNLTYRWSGSGYVEISPSPGSTDAVPEGATNQYFTAERARAAVTSVTGNAGTATRLAAAHTISATGDATGDASFDGSADVGIALTLAASGVTAGKYGSASTVPVITVDAKGRVTSISTAAVSGGGTGGGGSVSVDVTAPLTSTGGDNPVLGIDPATNDAPGSMSAADKAKLDGVAAGAAAVGNVVGAALGGASAGTAATAARSDHAHPLPTAANVGAVATSAVGAANGVAPLDSGGRVPAAYLPSYMDVIVEYSSLSAFPATGAAQTIYVAQDSERVYRWSGSAYVEISPSPGSTDAVPEGATNQYFSVSRVLSAILTGFSTASSAAVSATDSILTAIGKLQAQITGKAAVGSTAGAALAAAGAVGSATTAARSDHVHPFPSAANVGAVSTTAVGAANGVASLDSTGKVPAAQLPSTSGAALPYIHVREQTSGGQGSGTTIPSGNSVARVLNTVVTNTITGASLASNTLTLPAGTYRVQGSAPAVLNGTNDIVLHQTWLLNATTSSAIFAGSSERSYDQMTRSVLIGQFTLSVSATIQMMHYAYLPNSMASASGGIGVSTPAVSQEVFAELEITKVA